MQFLIPLLGFIPVILGYMVNSWMFNSGNYMWPGIPFGILYLILWAAIAYLGKKYAKSTTPMTVIFINIIPAIALILVMIQVVVMGRFTRMFIWATYLYSPLISIGYKLDTTYTIYMPYVIGFALMVVASIGGCLLVREKDEEEDFFGM